MPLLGQFHLAQEGFVARVCLKILEERIALDQVQPGVLLAVSTFKPRKRLVQFPAVGVGVGNPIRVVLRVLLLPAEQAPRLTQLGVPSRGTGKPA
jgi:hypothetical protein